MRDATVFVVDDDATVRESLQGLIESVGLESGTFSISPEFAIKAQLCGYRLGQVPTTYHNRRAGQPKFNMVRMGIEYASLFLLRLTYRKRIKTSPQI